MKYKDRRCDVVPLREIPSRKEFKHTYVMQHLDGSFADFLDKCSFMELIQNLDYVVYSVKRQIICLYSADRNFVYTDLKPGNIGIVYNKNVNYRSISNIQLIDLGSVFKDSADEYVGTFPCAYHNQGYFKLDTNEQKLRCIHISLIILIYFSLTKTK